MDAGGQDHDHSRGRRAVLGLVCSVVLAVACASVPDLARAQSGDVGFEGASHSGTSTPTGTKRAESVLWFNDGSWWANMWDTVSKDFHIFRLDRGTQRWLDTGVLVDARANTHADVLWDGAHLYVSSHTFVNDEQPAVSGFPSYLYRFSYNAVTKTYSLDPGFPAQINNYKTETLTIDRDSTGRLWATWQQDNRIYVNRTTGSDAGWGTPFLLPTASPVTVDDTPSLIAFAGRIGVLWSDQTSANDGMHFSIHRDGDPDTAWTGRQAAIQGPGSGDDHMNLKSLDAFGGRVYAAVKTSFTSSSAPLIMLLVYDISAGTWQSHTIARVSDCPNRVLVLVDPDNGLLHTFATYPAPPSFACSSSGGAIYEKTSPLGAISFPAGRGTLRILDANSPYVHNVSSTKQNVTNASGIAVLAANGQTQRYWHHFDPLGGAPPPGAPTAGFNAAPQSGTAPLGVTFTDTSTGSPTNWSWEFGDGGTSAAASPTHTYSSAGSYTVRLTVSNATGSDSTTKTITVTASQPPTAGFNATPTSGTAPLSVAFTDTSTGSPASWSWDFGDGGTFAGQSPPPHSYSSAGSYTARLTVSNGTGSDSAIKTITVTASPPGGAIVREAISTTVNATATTALTIIKPAGTGVGDVLVACLTLNGGAIAAGGTPAGWLPVASVTTAANPKVFGYYKVATASEPADYRWTLASAVTSGAGIARYSGATGLDVPAAAASGASGLSGAVPSLTTVTASAMLVGCTGINSSSSSTTIASPGGMTEAWDVGGKRHELADGIQAAAGASGTKTWMFSASRAWAGWLVALRPG
jgi:PKD repeat protein